MWRARAKVLAYDGLPSRRSIDCGSIAVGAVAFFNSAPVGHGQPAQRRIPEAASCNRSLPAALQLARTLEEEQGIAECGRNDDSNSPELRPT
jgi:hypothetical protein